MTNSAISSSVLQAAREIGPKIAARSDEIERARTLPRDVVEWIRRIGAFRMCVPDDLDGPGVTAPESLEVVEELAYHDGSAGWCSMISSSTSLLASYLPDPHAREIFGGRDAICGGFVMPAGRAVAVEGGLRATGRWPWGSGIQHCTCVGGGCRVVDEHGDPAPRGDGLATPFVFFDTADIEFIDNWHVSGLAGTGSCDYQVTEVFVPEGRWVEVGRSEPVRHNPWAKLSVYGLLACGVAACAVGIGRRAIHELVVLAESKKPQGSTRTLGERSQVQADVALAEAKLASAWSFMHDAISSSWATATVGDSPTLEQKRRLRLSATHATQTAAAVAELMYKAGGGAAVYRSSPLQRTFRDVFVATQHAMVAPRTFDTWGRLRLGLETDTTLL